MIKPFLLANINMNVVLGMLFLILKNLEINFIDCILNSRLYNIIEALQTSKQVELAKKTEFTAIILDPNDKTFVV